jgi:hypothetical protein
MAKRVNKWIQKTHLKKGSLSRQLGIPVKKNIPMTLLTKIQRAEEGRVLKHGSKKIKVTGLLKKRANLAVNLKKIR